MKRLPIALWLMGLTFAASPAMAQTPAMRPIEVPESVIMTPKPVETKFLEPRKSAPATSSRSTQTSTQVPKPVSTGEITPTPDMWYYQQYMQQYHTPTEMVYQRADLRATQRQQRLAAMKWFGYSNLRPQTGVDVTNGDHAPGWAANNGVFSSSWTGSGSTEVVIVK